MAYLLCYKHAVTADSRPSLFACSRWGTWILCAALALPSVIWPLGEWLVHPKHVSIFLPFLNQIDVALHLSWMKRLATDPSITDLTLWEYRHATGSPMTLIQTLPFLMSRCIGFFQTPASYWMVVYLLHVLWLRAVYALVSHWLPDSGARWIVAVLFVYTAFGVGINSYMFLWRFWKWSLMAVYENFRAFPSVAALMLTTLAIQRLYVASDRKTHAQYALAGLCVALTINGRPFDWMILVTFIGLMGLRSIVFRAGDWKGWSVCLACSILGATHFFVRYWQWSHQDTSLYQGQLVRGAMEGKDFSHFVKYAGLGALIIGFTYAWLCWLTSKVEGKSAWRRSDVAFWITLVIASFLPYFQFLPSGKTITGYQYFFVYFSIPVVWFLVLLGIALWVSTRTSRMLPARIGFFAALMIAFGLQATLAATPGWMVSRISFHQSEQPLYNDLKEVGNAVVLSPDISRGASQEQILRAGAWSFVPHPMMYTFCSMAPSSELLKRQLLAKLILTGTVSDLAPLFVDSGLPGYDHFREQATPETVFWIDRLENCPARSFFVFHPTKSRKDLEVRHITLPPALLQQPEVFAYFNSECRDAFREVQAMEGLKPAAQIDRIHSKFRLTHILLLGETSRFEPRLKECPDRFKLAARTEEGASLWRVD